MTDRPAVYLAFAVWVLVVVVMALVFGAER
jgi:Sec-independent protein translocase protein TatA